MVKKFTPPPRVVKARSSIRLPEGMKITLERVMLSQGWSLKRRSNWVAAACEDLLHNTDHDALIREEFYDGKTTAVPLAMDADLLQRLDTLAEQLSAQGKVVDRSAIIRTAITQAVLSAAGRRVVLSVPPGDSVSGGGVHGQK
jgi:metal-responsive CopG/Arc/MetJ family transcriptional regulator